MKQVDMTSEAISRRLRMASKLRDLSLSLSKAKPLTAEEAQELRDLRKKERLLNAGKPR